MHMKQIIYFFSLILPATSLMAAGFQCKAGVNVLDPIFNGPEVPQANGSHDDTKAIQHVLDYAVYKPGVNGAPATWGPACDPEDARNCCPPPQAIYFPPPKTWDSAPPAYWVTAPPVGFYAVSSISVHSNQRLIGNGKSLSALGSLMRGINSRVPGVIVIDNAGDSSQPISKVAIYNFSVSSNSSPAIKINGVQDVYIFNSSFFTAGTSTTAPVAMNISNTVRAHIESSEVAQTNGMGWAVVIGAHSDTIDIVRTVLAGGSLGNGVDIRNSRNVMISENKFIENSPGYGIRVGGADPNARDQGPTTNVIIKGNYFEQVSKPFSFGEVDNVDGITLSSNYVANYRGGSFPSHYFAYLGSVAHATITSNMFGGSGDGESFLLFGYNPPTNANSIQFLTGSLIRNNTVSCFVAGVTPPPPCKETDYLFQDNFRNTQQKDALLKTANEISFATESRAH